MESLTGAGGVGKTRVALRVAEEAFDDHPDGVRLAVAPLVDATLVPHLVPAAVGVR
jgi:predicted ATPase